ncbi:hypothetical protein HaLaN_25908 [Haematococcus lacustris]|uniref:Uncharacterized protein n=1 Tax=Haematococcus lacustris TaxID=44745 RepID=A0A6A0A3Z6_HAELA|nr:hypothetical protein HaLaN_25908 [Haematococcus lacustris]
MSSALLTSRLFMPAQVLAPLQANNARSDGLNGRPSDDRCPPAPALYAPALFVSRPVDCFPACHQSPGWRCAARVQENPTQAEGTFPAAGRDPFSAPRNRLPFCVADIFDVPGGLPPPRGSAAPPHLQPCSLP